jgi:hypothetical protein
MSQHAFLFMRLLDLDNLFMIPVCFTILGRIFGAKNVFVYV